MMQSQHSSNSTGEEINRLDPDEKILTDLQKVSAQLNLCRTLLPNHRGDGNAVDEQILVVIGFLEACAPRMIELIEAGAQGLLKESTIVRCLEVNDELCKVLSDCENVQVTKSQTASVDSNFSIDDDLKDLLLDSNIETKSSHAINQHPGDGKTSGMDDKDLEALIAASERGKGNETDEFDTFFDQRFSGK